MVYQRLAAGSALLSALFLAGCATYVNIPALDGDLAVHDPNVQSVQQVVTAALQALLAVRPIDGPYQVVLPKGMTGEYANPILKALGAQARWVTTTQPASGLPVLNACQVRIRGWLAQVDILCPRDPKQPLGFQQLVTVDLRWDLTYGWHSQQVRPWNINPEDALKISAHSQIEAQGVRPTQQQEQSITHPGAPPPITPPAPAPAPSPAPQPAPQPSGSGGDILP